MAVFICVWHFSVSFLLTQNKITEPVLFYKNMLKKKKKSSDFELRCF